MDKCWAGRKWEKTMGKLCRHFHIFNYAAHLHLNCAFYTLISANKGQQLAELQLKTHTVRGKWACAYMSRRCVCDCFLLICRTCNFQVDNFCTKALTSLCHTRIRIPHTHRYPLFVCFGNSMARSHCLFHSILLWALERKLHLRTSRKLKAKVTEQRYKFYMGSTYTQPVMSMHIYAHIHVYMSYIQIQRIFTCRQVTACTVSNHSVSSLTYTCFCSCCIAQMCVPKTCR